MPKVLKPEQGYDQSSMPKWLSRWVGQALRRWRMRRTVAELEMLDDRRQRHGERLRKLAHRGRPAAKSLDHGPPARIGERLKHRIEGVLMLKHILKYQDWVSRARGHGLQAGSPNPKGRNIGKDCRCLAVVSVGGLASDSAWGFGLRGSG